MKFISGLRRCVDLNTLLILLSVPAAAFAADAVSVRNAWARATAPGQTTAGAYMELVSDADAALIAVESPVAGSAELHTMKMDGGVMKMRAAPRIDLPARKTVKLAPGGLHVMLIGVRQPLKEGDKVALALTIQGAGGVKSTLKVEAEVRAVGGAEVQHHH